MDDVSGDDDLDWLDPPPVSAPSHEDRSQVVRYAISEDIKGGGRANFLNAPLLRVWTHLHGRLPPVGDPAAMKDDPAQPTLCTLADAIACFQGVNRPINDENDGESVLTYVLDIDGSVVTAVRNAMPVMGIPAAEGTVLTVQVTLTDSLHTDGSSLHGVVTRIEPVRSTSPDDPLPIDHAHRYGRRCW